MRLKSCPAIRQDPSVSSHHLSQPTASRLLLADNLFLVCWEIKVLRRDVRSSGSATTPPTHLHLCSEPLPAMALRVNGPCFFPRTCSFPFFSHQLPPALVCSITSLLQISPFPCLQIPPTLRIFPSKHNHVIIEWGWCSQVMLKGPRATPVILSKY